LLPTQGNEEGETMNHIESPFGFHSTAEEVIGSLDLRGKRAIVTGGGSGIGAETVRVLAHAGAEVTLMVRTWDAGESVATEIRRNTGNELVHVAVVDLCDISSIRSFANRWSGPLHILVNNAGVMATPEQRTKEGYELQFATNHLGHFALTLELHRVLAEAGQARVVCVSSTAHLFSPVVFDDVHFWYRPYDPLLAYAQSKTAVNLFAVAASIRWAKDGITANSLNPGAIKTNLQRHVGGVLRSPPEFHKTIAQGAATSVFVATSPLLTGIDGRYFDNCNEAVHVQERPKEIAKLAGVVAPYSLDPSNAERLWEDSLRMIARM
jgi:NAD(P)-dependent dehydrogenase (short-subunit alcohol dehydrogenase family)